MSASPLRIYTLPLFPLNLVLFPPFLLQMHIFEARYKAMLTDCIERDSPFGVVLIREGAEVGEPAVPYDIGCMVRIQEVETLEDGRMNLVVAAERRFRILEYMVAEQPYLVGRVEDVEDEPESLEALEEETGELTTLFLRYLTLLAERVQQKQPEFSLPTDPSLLSFCVAYIIQIPLPGQQRLLEMTDARERCTAELDYLREHVTILEAERENWDIDPHHALTFVPLEPESDRWKEYGDDSRN